MHRPALDQEGSTMSTLAPPHRLRSARHIGRRTRRLAALVTALSLLVGSGVASAAPSGGTDAGFCTTMKPKLAAMVEDLKAPGAVVLVRSPEIGNCFLSFGSGTLDGKRPIRLDDQFRIGSNTKTMTGTVVLQLVQEGKLRLDDPVSKYHVGVPNGDNITIAQLLNMRSGLRDYTGLPVFGEMLDAQPERVFTPDEVLSLGFAQPPAFAPGQGHLYANPNTVLLGLIIEQLTGQPLERVFEQRIYRPLGMTRTLLPAAGSNTMPEAHVHGYMFGSISEFVAGSLSPEQIAAANAGTLKPIDRTDMNPSWGWAAGAVISTTRDLARYAKALGSGELLNKQRQAERLASVQPIGPNRPDVAYGLGIVKYGEVYGHTGELPGFDSFMAYDPERDITIVAWSNLLNSPDGRSTGGTLATAITDELYAN
jgi:D-alanyl-D-alanine carboxypeptidase